MCLFVLLYINIVQSLLVLGVCWGSSSALLFEFLDTLGTSSHLIVSLLVESFRLLPPRLLKSFNWLPFVLLTFKFCRISCYFVS